ncbi:MAG: GGDEF domain-containing protein [Succinivibrio sp.]|nr:GGDEF domain-containing protein [Succinivibrio sp.]
MNYTDWITLQIDFVCLTVYLIITFYLMKSRDQNRYVYIGVVFVCILIVGCDIGTRFYYDSRCATFYSNNIICDKLNGATIVFSFCKYLFYFILIYVVSLLIYINSPNYSVFHKYKIFVGAIPFYAAVYLMISSMFDGRVLILTYNGLLIRGPYFYVLVAIIGLYSILGIYNALSIVSAQKERLTEITYYKSEYFLFYVAITLPFLLSTVGFLFDYPIVITAFALTFTYLMTIHQHLRLSVDELTSINNLNELRRYLDNLMQVPEKDRRQTFLIFIDIDRFKLINDKFGHNNGDIVLIQIARILKYISSSFNCFVCRYGGDEFIMIKKNANEEKASSICRYIEHSLGQLKELSLAPYDLSVSTGFTRFDRRFRSTQEFIDAADRLMYETKRFSKKDYSKILRASKTREIG